MASKPVVSCRNLQKCYGSGETAVLALKGVDLDVMPGQMTLLAGPSGCGKTTLLCLIAGLLEPSKGALKVLQQDVSRMSQMQKIDFRGKNIGFVFQQYNLLPALTAAENATVPLIIQGQRRGPALQKANELLAKLGMGNRAHAYPRELSGGQQQRVAIARALIHEPRLIVCDEPTSALDAETGQKMMELLKQIALSADRAVLVVTHDERVFKYGDRIVHMNDGQITHQDTRIQTPKPESDLALSGSLA
jgi:putative ABC transport system ATP-binding protein